MMRKVLPYAQYFMDMKFVTGLHSKTALLLVRPLGSGDLYTLSVSVHLLHG